MILSLLLLTQPMTLDRLANVLACGFVVMLALGLWILLEVLWLGDDLKKAGKL